MNLVANPKEFIEMLIILVLTEVENRNQFYILCKIIRLENIFYGKDFVMNYENIINVISKNEINRIFIY